MAHFIDVIMNERGAQSIDSSASYNLRLWVKILTVHIDFQHFQLI